MGVHDLWQALIPAVEVHDSLTAYSLAAFNSTPNLRGLRLGVDVSLWLVQTSTSHRSLGGDMVKGANGDLKTLFYKVLELLTLGILPLFVFDGPNRPKKFKRSGQFQRISPLGLDLIKLLDLLGLNYIKATGEAEAELAVLVERGHLDAILTDDCDTFLFTNSVTIIRNQSKTLTANLGKGSGNAVLLSQQSQQPPSQHSASQLQSQPFSSQQGPSSSQPQSTQPKSTASTDNLKIAVYTSANLLEKTGLERSSLILLGILLGGDYTEKASKIGIKTALGLAAIGFGSTLFEGIGSICGDNEHGIGKEKELKEFFKTWREEVAEELKTNSTGLLPQKSPSKSSAFLNDTSIPDLKIINYYLKPNVSSPLEWKELNWNKGINLADLVEFTKLKFEWLDGDLISKYRGKFYQIIVMRAMRLELLKEDNNRKGKGKGKFSFEDETTQFLSPSSANSNLSTLLSSSLTIPFSLSLTLHSITSESAGLLATQNLPGYKLRLTDKPLFSILIKTLKSLPPLINPLQRINSKGELVIKKDDKSILVISEEEGNGKTGRASELIYWMPKGFLVGESFDYLVDEFERKNEEKIASQSQRKGKGKASAKSKPQFKSKVVPTRTKKLTKKETNIMVKKFGIELMDDSDEIEVSSSSEDDSDLEPVDLESDSDIEIMASSSTLISKYKSNSTSSTLKVDFSSRNSGNNGLIDFNVSKKSFTSSSSSSTSSSKSSSSTRSTESITPKASDLNLYAFNRKITTSPAKRNSALASSDLDDFQSSSIITKSPKKSRNHNSASSSNSTLKQKGLVIDLYSSDEDEYIGSSSKTVRKANLVPEVKQVGKVESKIDRLVRKVQERDRLEEKKRLEVEKKRFDNSVIVISDSD